MKIIKTILHHLKDNLPALGSVRYNDVILPPSHRRWCGPEFKGDAYFFKSAVNEANRLKSEFECTEKSRILDVGCGFGRLPIGLLQVFGHTNYIGMDVHKQSINWCRRFIEKQNPECHFQHINIVNDRYNYKGKKLEKDFQFSLDSESVDIIYLFSVFSHMKLEELRTYLTDFQRIMVKGGKLFFTTFVEENVPNVSINPVGYLFERYSGPLHVVRYEKDYLFKLIKDAGFILSKFSHASETDKQSALYAEKLCTN